jgi:hypothetical protein
MNKLLVIVGMIVGCLTAWDSCECGAHRALLLLPSSLSPQSQG